MPTRGRKRTRDAAIVGAIAVVVVGLLRTTAGLGGSLPPLPTPTAPPPPTVLRANPPRIAPVIDEDLIGVNLYVADGRSLLLTNLTSGWARSLPVPGSGGVTSTLRHGSTIVVQSAGTVSVLADHARELVPIGTADDVLPSSDPSTLWLAWQGLGADLPVWEITRVRLDVESVRARSIRLPPGERPLAVVRRDTTLITTDGTELAGYDLYPSGDRLGRPRIGWPAATFVDSIGSLVALVDRGGELRIADLDEGTYRMVPRPPEVARWIPSAGADIQQCCRRLGAFSPDGDALAVTVEGPTGEDSVSVVYTTRLVVRPVRGSAEAMGTSCLPCFDWLPSGGWLVFALDEPSRLAAYRLGHQRAHTLGVKTSPGRLSFALR